MLVELREADGEFDTVGIGGIGDFVEELPEAVVEEFKWSHCSVQLQNLKDNAKIRLKSTGVLWPLGLPGFCIAPDRVEYTIRSAGNGYKILELLETERFGDPVNRL